MKKIDFYRFRHDHSISKDSGYLVAIAHGEQVHNFIIAKSRFNNWDITHQGSGQKVSITDFLTVREAKHYLHNENFLAALERLLNKPTTKKLIDIFCTKCQEVAQV